MISTVRKLIALSAVCVMTLLPGNVAVSAQKNSERAAAGGAVSLETAMPSLRKAPAKAHKFVPIGPRRTTTGAFVNPRNTIRYKSPLRLPARAVGDQPAAIGSVYSCDGWTDSNKALGPYAIGLQSYAVERMAQANTDGVAASFYYDGKYYMASAQYSWIFYNGMLVEVFDAETWECLSSETLDIEEFAMLDLKWNPADNRIYGCCINGESYSFGTLDPTDFTFTPISKLGSNAFVGFAIYNSVGYGINQYGDLYKVDLYTGKSELIAATGLSIDTKTSAAIDQETGKMYFLTNGGTSALYEINLANANAIKIYDLPSNERIVGLTIPSKTAAAAPAPAENFTVSAVGATTECNVSFAIPTVNNDGSAASGDVKYTVSANGKTVAEGNAECGATVSTSVTVDGSALYTFAVVLENASGSSKGTSVSVFVGEDTPKPSDGVTIERTAADKLTVSWKTPESVNGGYLDADALTYDITDIAGNTVKTGVKGNSCEIDFVEPEELTTFQYGVIAHYKDVTLDAVWSNILTFGNIKPPYKVDFSEVTSLDVFTILNSNDDEEEWQLTDYGYVQCLYSNDLPMDDWLITPGVILEAGKTYGLLTTVSCYMSSCPERIEIKAGMTPTAEAMTVDVLAPYDVVESSEETIESKITVETTGVYYIGFHGISDPGQFALCLYGLEIQAPSDNRLPAKVEDLTVSVDQSGAKSAVVSFTAPSKTISDADLTSLSSGVVTRNGEVIKTIENPEAGRKYTITDTQGEGGLTEYAVYFVNEAGQSEAVSASVFVGLNVPAAITEATAQKGENGSVVITWSEVTADVDGKIPPAGSITYEIVLLEGNNQVPVAKDLTTNTYTIENAYDAEGEQVFKQWGVFPVNETGHGAGMATNGLILGADYTVPFVESFADKSLSHLWLVEAEQSAFGATVSVLDDSMFSDVSSQDGDNGLLAFTADYAGSTAAILSGIIDLNVTSPVLTFYSIGVSEDNANEVAVSVNSGYGWENVKTFVINGNMSWNRYRVDLSQYAGEKVRIKIHATILVASAVIIDNISIRQGVDYDLAVSSISAPSRIKAGETGTVKVKIENFGSQASGAYTLNLFADGVQIGSADGESVDVDGSRTHEFTLECNATTPDVMSIYAQLVYGADEDADNNESEHVTVKVPKHDFPTPQNLSAVADGSSVRLEWDRVTVPELTLGEAVEDFESAESFEHEVSGWTMVDLDNRVVGSIEGVNIPGIEPKQTRSSFFVFDNKELGANEGLNAHSGDKCLATIFNYDDSRLDDWAISPVLSGDAQTITFYAKSFHHSYLEQIEVYYTLNESVDPADFVKVDGVGGIVPDEWTLYSADLPAGARRFAIRSCAAGSFILLVDDISYNGYMGVELNHLGYNVYDNGVKANEAVITAENTSLENVTDGSHTFHVTAVYEEGESRASEPAKIDVSLIDDAVAGGISIAVVGNEVVITGAAGHNVSVAAPDGRIVAAAVAGDCCRIRLAGGVYVVTAGDKVAKVVVR